LSSRSQILGGLKDDEPARGFIMEMEVWIENTGMIELLPPAFASEYLTLARRRGAHAA
jgi:hypothetical protein